MTVDCTAGAPYTYSGVAQEPCTAEATGVGMDPVDVTDSIVYSANVHAGTASAAASWDGDDDHTGNTGSSTFVIGQASSTVTVDCTAGAPYTYSGVAQEPCTAEATGVGMDPVDVTDSIVYSANVHAGTASAAASWDGDDDHTGNTGSSTFVIGQASSTVTVDCTAGAPYTYSGVAQEPCTAEATGVGMDPVDVTDSIVYSANVHAGTASAAASWDGDDDHTGNTGSSTFVIGQASSTVTVDCTAGAPYTYSGVAQEPCTAEATGVGMDPVDVTDSIVYSANVHAGTASAAASWDGDDDHTGNTGSSTFVIGQASSTVTVDCTAGAPYTYSGVAQEPCTAEATGVGMDPVDVTDSIVYSANVHAGTASAAASWDGDDEYNTGNTGSSTFVIGQASSTVTVHGYDVTYDGGAHTATGTVSGVLGESLTGLDLSGTMHTNAGTYSDPWTFTDRRAITRMLRGP